MRDGFALIGLGVRARTVGLAAGTFAGLATVVLAVRLLEPAAYGALAFGLSTAVVFAGVGRLGLEAAVARAIAIDPAGSPAGQAHDVAHGALSLVALTGVAGSVATFAVIELWARGIDNPSRTVLAVSLGLVLYGSNLAAVAGALARGRGRVVSMELPNLVATLGRFAAVGLLAVLGVASLGWVAFGYGVAAIAGILASVYVTRSLGTPSSVLLPGVGVARRMLVSSLPFAATGLAMIVISRFDVLVLGIVSSSAEVGHYEPVLRIVEQAMLLVPLLFTAQFLPVASRVFAAGRLDGFRDLYVSISKITFVVAFPAVILLAAFPEAVLHGLYGAEFPASGLVVWLLLPGFTVNLVCGLNGSALAATGRRGALARSGAGATVAMIALGVVLVPWFGPEGAAAATSGTYIVLNLWVAIELYRITGAHPLRRDFVATLATAGLPLAAALALHFVLGPVDLWRAAAVSVGLAAAWAVLLLGIHAVRPFELRRLATGSP